MTLSILLTSIQVGVFKGWEFPFCLDQWLFWAVLWIKTFLGIWIGSCSIFGTRLMSRNVWMDADFSCVYQGCVFCQRSCSYVGFLSLPSLTSVGDGDLLKFSCSLLFSVWDANFCLFLFLFSWIEHEEEGKNEQYDLVYIMPLPFDKLYSPWGIPWFKLEQ